MNSYRRAMLVGTLVGLTAASTANAADMYRKAPPATPLTPAEVSVIQPSRAYDWTGLYVGGFVEYGFGPDTVGLSAVPHVNIGKAKVNGFGGGIGVGYNYQSGNFVAGLEADFALSDAHDNLAAATFFGASAARIKYDWIATVRPRVGYAYDNLLVYVTGGLAMGGIDYRVSAAVPATTLNKDSTRFGFAAGAGLEYAFSRRISVKTEYLLTKLATETYSFGGGTYRTQSIGLEHHFRIGLNYHF